MKFLCLTITLVISINVSISQTQIGDFTSVVPTNQGHTLVIPSTHKFQYIIETGDSLDVGGVLGPNNDFTGYVPINNSSENGYLSINSEASPGGVAVLDINLDTVQRRWNTTYSEAIDFSSVGGTSFNCSGAVTPWGTVISCEEYSFNDSDGDGYKDNGWAVEVDPSTKTVINKVWAAGNFNHENASIHPNQRTLYQGADSYPGYLYKFVADVAGDLSSGLLYVYSGSKDGAGDWLLLENTTQEDRNTTIRQSEDIGATEFLSIEDVEIGPDGKVYMAVNYEGRVYRFDDSDPISGTTVTNFETFVGDMAYDITHEDGVTSEFWGNGNDNLAFDGDGNLWVLQDGGDNYIWVVGSSHTQEIPDVRIFGITPSGSEPTGITFTPDYKYLMMSIQHPWSSNSNEGQQDAFGDTVFFNKSVSIVIALDDDLGPDCNIAGTPCDDGNIKTLDDKEDGDCNCGGTPVNTLVNSCNMISSANDDAEENGIDNSMELNSSTLELVNDGSQGDQVVGLRFRDMQVPAGAIITNAFIQFTASEISTSFTDLTITAEDSGDAVVFENVVSNISTRTKTPPALDVSWSPQSWGTLGESGVKQQTPDLKNIVQHLINRSDYAKGNSIAMILFGTGKRTAESYEGNVEDAPMLCIEYKLCHTDLVLDSYLGNISGTYEATNSITLIGPVNILSNNSIHLKSPNINIQNIVNISEQQLIISPDGCMD